MVRCEMCGMEVPAGPNGKCFLGHALRDGVLVSAAATVAAPVEAPSVIVAAPEAPPAAAPLVESSPMFAAPAPPPVFPTSISPDLIAAAVAEVEKSPESDAVPEELAASPPPLFTAPRPLGDPPAAPTFAAPAPTLAAPAPTLAAPAPTFAAPAPTFAAPAATFAAPVPAAVPEPDAAPTEGSAALAIASEIVPSAPAVEMFVMSPEREPSRSPNKALLIVLVVAVLGGAAFAAKSFLGGSEPATEAGSPARGPRVSEAGSLVRAFVADQTHRYRITATVQTTMRKGTESESFDADVEMLFSETVTGGGQDGSTTLRYTFDHAKMSVAGEHVDVPISPGMGMEVVVGPDGKVVSVKPFGGGELPVDNSFHEMLAPVLPPGSKPGARWSRVDTPSLPTVGTMKITTAFHYVKDEGDHAIVDSKSEAPFSMSIDGGQLGKLAKGAGTFEMRGRLLSSGRQTVEKATGRTVAADADMAMTFAILENGTEAGRMAMKVKFSLGPATVSAAAA